jgi:hypothetical protein
VILEPDWAQPRPTFAEVRAMTQRIGLAPVTLPERPFSDFLSCLRESHSNGGAHIAALPLSNPTAPRFVEIQADNQTVMVSKSCVSGVWTSNLHAHPRNFTYQEPYQEPYQE